MKNNGLLQTVRTAVSVCPWDCLLMNGVQLGTALLPTAVLLANRSLVRGLGVAAGMGEVLGLLTLYCAALFFQRFLVNWYNHYYLTYHSLLRFEKKIKIRLFAVCARMGLSDYDDPQIENATLRAKNASVNILRVYQAIGEACSALLGALGMSLVLSAVSRSMAAIILLLACSSVLENLFIIYQNKKLLYQNTQPEKEAEEYAGLLLKPGSQKEIRALGCSSFVLGKWKEAFDVLKRAQERKNKRIFLFSLGAGLLSFAGQAAAYGILFVSFLEGKTGIGEFSVSIAAFGALNGLVGNLFEVLGGIGQFLVMVKPYFEFASLAAQRTTGTALPAQEGDGIRAEHVRYRYPGAQTDALKDVSLEIKAGEKVAIVGTNGSGKTTLLHLLLGLYEPSGGRILYGGIPGGQLAEEAHLKRVSAVPQDFQCYAVSLRDNIAFGVSLTQRELAGQLAQVHLSALAGKEDAVLGREFGGIGLSGGQKQRIAILRAGFKGGDMIAFDEPTSAIDPFEEKEIFDAMRAMMQGRTALIISHRLSLARECDRIFVLEKGRLVESGAHEELCKADGVYAGMWRVQADLYA